MPENKKSMFDYMMEKDGSKPSVSSELLAAIPTSWLDPLLTGKNAVIGQPPYNCQDIEQLLWAIKKRMESIINSG